MYNVKHLKTKIKSYEVKISTNFHDDKVQNEGSNCICSSALLVDLVVKLGNKLVPSSVFRRM